ncbi:CmcI family methyltransferase [Paenibacillus rhizoplanae]|uniref:Class I SAM-dependent methyltransferase n=1 Tax=Paenibacillus rhizoplanae TaxID=1917181 RepID=A0ABW5F8R6_9BACL
MTTIAQCLRFLPVEPLKHYIHKRYNNLPWVHKFGLDHIHFQGEVLVIHHSKPGFITLSAGQAEELKQSVKEGRTDSAVLDLLPEDWFRDTTGSGLIDGLLDKVLIPGLFERLTPENLKLDVTDPESRRLRAILEGVPERMPLFPAIQNPYELREFLELVQKRKPKTVVEIGTAGGGVFYSLCQLADANARLISIDYPGGPYGGGQDEYEVQLYSGFGAPGQQLSFIRDRSFHHSTKQDLIRLLGDRQIDLLFIDGDHSYGGVSSDYHMYRQLVSQGGIIAFHDIHLHPKTWGRGYDVGIYWNEVKLLCSTCTEISDPEGSREPSGFQQNGRSLSYGIGIVHN